MWFSHLKAPKNSIFVVAILGLMINSTVSQAENNHIFLVTPRVIGPSPIMIQQTGTAIYQITNNSNRALSGIGLVNLQPGVTLVPNLGYDYCLSPINLAPGQSCLVKLAIDSTISGNVIGGPKVCYSSSNPIYCSQPFAAEQLSIKVTPFVPSTTCQDNIANFNSELAQTFDIPPVAGTGWGPTRNTFPLSTNNPNIANCLTDPSAGTPWQQGRVLAAADFWIKQKLNYCEHHVPDFQTPVSQRGNIYGAPNGGYCNPVVDLAPQSVYYNQQARWNYSGTGSEILSNWVNGAMWYGFDCSNYTAFLYDFSFGVNFSSGIKEQSGQIQPTSSEGPNNGGAQYYQAGSTSGYLVCQDGTSDNPNNTPCNSPTNPYISTIDSSGNYSPTGVTVAELTNALKPGDLIYVAGDLVSHAHTPAVTHVIMWTGKTIGTGADQINPRQIAPNELCQQYWQPINGAPVITDSHYQGPDYRMLTQCFYIENIWAVRRVISE